MKKMFASLVAAFSAAAVFAANQNVSDLSTLPASFFFEGDTVTLPAGSYTLMGDAVATVSGNVVTCKKSGFTLVNDGSATYRLNVAPVPKNGGDVFFAAVSGSSLTWTGVTWTKVTSNSDRAYPDHANDIAMIFGTGNYYVFTINSDISLHGVVCGYDNNGTPLKGVATTLTMCGSAEDPAYIRVSGITTENRDFRIGVENGNDANTLFINCPEAMELDFCGDSTAASSWTRGRAVVALDSAIVDIPDGHVFSIKNCSQNKSDSFGRDRTTTGCFTGTGKIVVEPTGSFSIGDVFYYNGAEFAGTVEIRGSATAYQIPYATAVKVAGRPNAGRTGSLQMGQETTQNPGVNIFRSKSVELDGALLKFMRVGNENAAWYNGASSPAERLAMLGVTNRFDNLTLTGDCCFYNDSCYGSNRVHQLVFVNNPTRTDDTATLTLNGFDFRTNGSGMRGATWSDKVYATLAASDIYGRDPEEGDSDYVYKICPWIEATCNDNGYSIYEWWGSQMQFPEVRADGSLMVHPRNNWSRNGTATDENAYYSDKEMGLSADRTVNSLAYNSNQGMPWHKSFNLGQNRTLTITSGGLILGRARTWLGDGIGSDYANRGKVVFGARAYVFSDYGAHPGTGNDNEWNAIFCDMTAPYGFVKGGCGELVIAGIQTNVQDFVCVNGGTLWLGHPGLYRQDGWTYANYGQTNPEYFRGCALGATNFTVRAGAVLGVCQSGYDCDGNGTIGDGEVAISRDAVINLHDNAAASAKIEIAPGADQTCFKLYIDGKAAVRGTYGASGSGADFVDDLHFSGSGKLTVRKDDEKFATVIVVM